MTDVQVVAAAIVRDARVLAARRSRPPALAGGWEFPGGKVEPGESPAQALERECAEELGVDVRVGRELGGAAEVSGARRLRLTLYACEMRGDEPRAGADHAELRWLAADELDTVGWLPLDAGLLTAVRGRLTGAQPPA